MDLHGCCPVCGECCGFVQPCSVCRRPMGSKHMYAYPVGAEHMRAVCQDCDGRPIDEYYQKRGATMDFEALARWLWYDHIPLACHCNPLSIPAQQAETLIARYAWENSGSEVAAWYRSSSEVERSQFRHYWYSLCSALR